jgi:hypothetical protein
MTVAATRPVMRGQFGGDAKIWPREHGPECGPGTLANRDNPKQDPTYVQTQDPAQDRDKWAAARNSRVQALRAWQAIALTLAQSEEHEDRALAVQTLRYLRGVPAVQERPRDTSGPAPVVERDGTVGQKNRRLDHTWER